MVLGSILISLSFTLFKEAPHCLPEWLFSIYIASISVGGFPFLHTLFSRYISRVFTNGQSEQCVVVIHQYSLDLQFSIFIDTDIFSCDFFWMGVSETCFLNVSVFWILFWWSHLGSSVFFTDSPTGLVSVKCPPAQLLSCCYRKWPQGSSFLHAWLF